MKKNILLLTLFCFIVFLAQAQKRTFRYQAEAGGAVSDNRLPFWLHTQHYGKITQDAYLWGNIGLFSDFKKSDTRALDFSIGFEGTGLLGKDDHKIFVDQLFGRVRWQNLVLDLGMLHRDIEYDGLSASNGDMLYSTNARSFPGISLSTYNFIRLPWVGKWVSFRARYAEYRMIDKRVMGNRTRLHNKLLGIRLTPFSGFSIEGGIEDYAQWGGKNRYNGVKAPVNFKDYVRLVMIKSGGGDANQSDQINKFGNHIGMHFLKIAYQAPSWETKLYYNHLFEDGSGMHFKNTPDGLYGIYFGRLKGKKWFKSFMYELYYTKNQSGPFHNDPVTDEVLGGNDNYFNHGDYQSGWTYYGRTIGSPFFTPYAPGPDGVCPGIFNSRFVAHHFGICGSLPGEIQYKLLFSYSENYGTHSLPFYDEHNKRLAKSQYSFGAEFIAPDLHLPFNIALNLGFDKGDLLKNNFGCMLRIFKTGIF